jgi:hypothetical protein
MNRTNRVARGASILIWLVTSLTVSGAAQTGLQTELSALRKRGTSLETRLDSPNQSTASQAAVDYKAYVADFKAFAGKYHLSSHGQRISKSVLSSRPTVTVAQADHDKRVPKGSGGCPWLTETATEQCVRTDETKDYCDYFCVAIPPSTGGKVTTIDPNADPTKQ